MGFRDNFKQALDEMIGNNSNATAIDPEASTDALEDVKLESPTIHVIQPVTPLKATDYREATVPDARPRPVDLPVARPTASVGKTIITKGTSIKGDLLCEGDLDVQGAIQGNVTSQCLVRITGKVEGNVSCDSLELENAEIRGQVTVKNQLLIRGESIVVGDLSGQMIEINGKVKGNITASGSLHLLPLAYVLGDMNTSGIQIDNGAVVFGRLNITSGSDSKVNFDQFTMD